MPQDEFADVAPTLQLAQLRFADRLALGRRLDDDRDFEREDILLATDSFVAISDNGDRPYGQTAGRDEQFEPDWQPANRCGVFFLAFPGFFGLIRWSLAR